MALKALNLWFSQLDGAVNVDLSGRILPSELSATVLGRRAMVALSNQDGQITVDAEGYLPLDWAAQRFAPG